MGFIFSSNRGRLCWKQFAFFRVKKCLTFVKNVKNKPAERLSKPDSCHAGSTEDLVVPKRVGPAAKGNVAKAVTPRMFWKLLPPDPTEKFSPSREITPSSLKLRIHNRLYENLQLLPPTTDVVGSRLKAALVCRMFGRCSEGQRTNGDI
ncbi:uncharacterized protein LOC119766710 [Culex quinquefasciatus]|uniref:uncharacterized protein LOC119766710 n=1 Tax=Culex quinquefasciatus TaxID=7176 RepID=UPI0018E2C7AD|nr:uncharacterized protein LOC119766710 [Culex quinquefasciatus]